MTYKARFAVEYFILVRIVGGTHSEKVLGALLFLHASRNLTLCAQKKAAGETYLLRVLFRILCAMRCSAFAGLAASLRITMALRRSKASKEAVSEWKRNSPQSAFPLTFQR